MASAAAGGKPVMGMKEIWGDLEDGLKQIYERQQMGHKRYMELYT